MIARETSPQPSLCSLPSLFLCTDTKHKEGGEGSEIIQIIPSPPRPP